MGYPRKLQEPRGWAFGFCVALAEPLLRLLTKRRWIDGEKIPADGGCVVVGNHVSHLDPLTFAHFVYGHGRIVRFLAKAEVFDVPVLGRLLRATGQIPVYRMTTDASRAFSAAVAAVEEGKCVVVYPEGTITRDPDLWPMVGKTGAARIALGSGAPVIPVAQWGAQEILWRRTPSRPRLFPRKTISMKAGDPVDLDDLRDQPLTPEVLHEATERIMDDVTALLEDIRGEQGARRTLRLTGRRGQADRQPEPGPEATSQAQPADRRERDEQGGGVRCGVVGYRVLHRARRRRPRRHDLGAARGRSARRSTTSARTPTTSPASSCPETLFATHDPSGPLAGAEFVVLAVPSQTLRENLDGVGRPDPARRRAGVADEGRRARHAQADERGDRRGHRRRSRADRRGQRPQPGQGDRPPGARRQRRGLRRRARSPSACARPCHSPAFRPYSSTDVVGCELGGAYKNVIALGRRDGRRPGLRRQHHRLGDHPRAGRDRPAGHRAGRRPDDADGAGRPRRPRRHLLLAAVAQPDLRREARAGHDHRGDHRLDPAGRRGREVLLVAAGPRRAAPTSTRRSWSTCTPSSRAR